ncbi:hypothetical protein LRC484719_29780 [Mycobacterium riyadhense]
MILQVAATEFDDLRLDVFPRFLAFAHAAKSYMYENTALAFRTRRSTNPRVQAGERSALVSGRRASRAEILTSLLSGGLP